MMSFAGFNPPSWLRHRLLAAHLPRQENGGSERLNCSAHTLGGYGETEGLPPGEDPKLMWVRGDLSRESLGRREQRLEPHGANPGNTGS